MKLNLLKDKKILILGFGQEGQDTYNFLRRLFPNKTLGVADQKKIPTSSFKLSKVNWHLGDDYLKAVKKYDLIIKSPGVPFKILPKSCLKKITSQTKIFFDNYAGKIIGIAGTKGKGTTSSLIYSILKEGGYNAYLIGNIGKPVLSFLLKNKKNNIFVYELSSFQLMDLEKSPEIAVLVNNYPDHLDYHKNLQEYINANANITKYQTKDDYLIYNSQEEITRKIAKKSNAQKIGVKASGLKLNQGLAREVGKIFKISEKKIQAGIKKFKPQPHRLELVGTYQGITFYDDSAATIPEATLNALDILSNKVQTLILGGSDKGSIYKNLAQRILKSKIKTLILFPPTGEQILKAILSANKNKKLPLQYFLAQDMKEAVKLAYLKTEKKKVCLLSPAAASFGIFRNYHHRGHLYKYYVKKYSC